MTDTDSSPNASKSPMVHVAIAAGIVVLLLIIYVVFSGSDEEPVAKQPVEIPIVTEPDPEPVTLPEPTPEPEEVLPPDPVPMPEPTPEPEPEPIDVSDAAVKTAIVALAEMPTVARFLVDEDLLRRFVVFTENLANEQLAANHHLLRAPENSFRVYRQAGKEWIDSSSYQRYSGYVNAFDSIEAEELLQLYEVYKPSIDEIFAEIGNPDDNFNYRLVDAIDHLLDTPEIPVPVEVYTDSVMYKYRIDQIEDLSAPQKQLLRTGPENMRVIKAKLREIKALLGQ